MNFIGGRNRFHSAPPAQAAQSNAGGQTSFKLLRWFSVLSLIAIIFVVGGATILMTRFLTRNLLLRDAIVSRDFLEGVLTTDVGEDYFRRPAEQRDMSVLRTFVKHMSSLSGIVAADIYGADGVVAWSSEEKLIGQRVEAGDQLRRALRGYVVVEWGPEIAQEELRSRKRAFDDKIESDHLVRTYLPIRGESADNIFAVVEIVSTPHALFDSISDGIWLLQSISFGVGVVLYLAFLGIIYRADTTLKRQLERIRESEALATVGEMSAAVAHSIRNPLACIRSAAELAREEEPGNVDECLADIIHEADRLNRWVSELLMAAHGNVEFSDSVDINEVVHESLNGRALESSRRNIAVSFDKEALPSITGSRALLSHAIHNVIVNAQEAMAQGGRLTVQSRLLADGRIRLSIEDTGEGVPAHIASRIFRPMFTTKPNGVGLGLALTKRIIERHSGEIVIRTLANRGARVELTLPVRG